MDSDLATAFVRWAFIRAALARGWWLTTSLYLVVIAHLSPPQLVLLGAFQGLTVVIAEVPAGVLADAVSRRVALVVAHLVMGAGMALTGVVSAYPLLAVSQCLWGLGWAISSGADVAWITDELGRPDLIDRVLTAQGRYDLWGTALGIVAFGAFSWATTLSTAMLAAGLGMIALGIGVVARWPEAGFTPSHTDQRWAASTAILRRGIAMARGDRVIALVLAATVLVNGGAEGFGRLFARRLVALGLPADPNPIAWFAAIGLLAAAFGAITLRCVEARVERVGVARRTYVAACGVGALGLVLFAHAPNTPSAVAGALLVSGIGLPISRLASTILINRRTTSDARATVHSFLSQAENIGEILCGLGLALIAGSTSVTVTLMGSALLLGAGGFVVSRAGADTDRLGVGDRRGGPGRVDQIFAEPRLAAIYDTLDSDRTDLVHYLNLVDELEAVTILDIGCGTGVFACMLAAHGKDVTALDPAAASLAVARRKPHAQQVRWLEGDAGAAPALGVDLVTMTGNVAQVFLTDTDWTEALESIHAALRPGGYFVFEARDPARRAWENWNRGATERTVTEPDGGTVRTWVELIAAEAPLVSFRHLFQFESEKATLKSRSTLCFRTRDELLETLRDTGFAVVEVRDAPDRPGLEWVFIARRPTASDGQL